MKKLYYRKQELEEQKGEKDFSLRLTETQDGVYEMPSLQFRVQSWAYSHQESDPNSFPSLLAELIMAPMIDFCHKEKNYPNDALYKQAVELVTAAHNKFLKTLLIKGVEDPKANQAHLEAYVEEVYESLKALTNKEHVIWDEEGREFIKTIHELAKARDENVWDEIADGGNLAHYYPENPEE